MDLNSLELVVRPRSHWEATDLGCLMARRWAKLVYGGWCATALPITVVVLVTLSSVPALAALVVWWLKPLYERLPLWLLSQAIFGDEPRIRDGLRQWRTVLAPQLLKALTLRRFSPTRAFDAPVGVLEGLGGVPRRDRLQILQRSAGSQAFWLTVLGVHVEAFLTWSVLAILVVLIPSGFEVDLWALVAVDETGAVDWVFNLAYLLAITLVGPVYVAAGFALYLNRRIELEGWDIELAFRRLVERAAVVLLAAVVVSAALPVERAHAASPGSEESRALIDEVLSADAFNERVTVKIPAFLRDLFEPEETETPSEDLDWLASLVSWLSAVAEVLLWIAFVVALGWIGYRAWLGIEARGGFGSEKLGVPARLVGLDLSPESLPQDPVAAARAEFTAGDVRPALALLYRAALVELISHHGCSFSDSATEGECVRLIRGRVPEAAFAYFVQLTRAWQQLAYAHRTVAEGDFERLCRGWVVLARGRV